MLINWTVAVFGKKEIINSCRAERAVSRREATSSFALARQGEAHG